MAMMLTFLGVIGKYGQIELFDFFTHPNIDTDTGKKILTRSGTKRIQKIYEYSYWYIMLYRNQYLDLIIINADIWIWIDTDTNMFIQIPRDIIKDTDTKRFVKS